MQNHYNAEEITKPTVIEVEIVIIFSLNFCNCNQKNRRNKSQINEKKYILSFQMQPGLCHQITCWSLGKGCEQGVFCVLLSTTLQIHEPLPELRKTLAAIKTEASIFQSGNIQPSKRTAVIPLNLQALWCTTKQYTHIVSNIITMSLLAMLLTVHSGLN